MKLLELEEFKKNEFTEVHCNVKDLHDQVNFLTKMVVAISVFTGLLGVATLMHFIYH